MDEGLIWKCVACSVGAFGWIRGTQGLSPKVLKIRHEVCYIPIAEHPHPDDASYQGYYNSFAVRVAGGLEVVRV